MRKLKTVLFGGLLATTCIAGAQGIQATVDGQPVHFRDVQPMMVGGRVMVPLRGVFEHMGANVQWFPETRTVIAQKGNTEIRLPVGSSSAWVGGQQVSLDSPAIMRNGRTMVPLRFMAESLDASVDWIAEQRTVAILTTGNVSARPTNPVPEPVGNVRTVLLPANTVIPFKLNTRLTSNGTQVGDKFTATIDPPNGMNDYSGLPEGTRVEGRIHTVRAREGNTPGVLGFDFTRIILPNGRAYPMDGALIGLDSKSVTEEDGRLVAKPEARNDNLKYVGYGAGAGLILSILGKGDALTNALIGGALGWLFGEIERSQQKPRDVTLEPGTKFGVRLTEDLRIGAAEQRLR